MTVVRWIAPVLLAVVLAAAAGAKLAAPERTRASFVALRLPVPNLLAVAVPAVELITAFVLIARPDVGGALALALLAAFSAFLTRLVAKGSATPCACFGQVRAEPVSSVDVLRNGILMVLAILAMVWSP